MRLFCDRAARNLCTALQWPCNPWRGICVSALLRSLVDREAAMPIDSFRPTKIRMVFGMALAVGAHHLLALVNDILHLSRIEAGRIDLRHQEFAAADVMSEVLSVTGPRAEAKNITLRGEVSPALFAYGDRTRFKQILYNLLSKAVKFMLARGRVRVTAEPDYGEIRLGLRDSGSGIPPEQHTNSSGRERCEGGSRFGRGDYKRIVELYGGCIWVESATGEGSGFTMPPARAAQHASGRQSWSTA